MKYIRNALFALVGLCLLIVSGLYISSDIDPKVWAPAPDQKLDGIFAPNKRLAKVKRIQLDTGDYGPEDITKGPDGFYYTGLENGKIIRFDLTGRVQDFVNTKGRPLGMQFDASGQLIVADGSLGLISVASDGAVTVLVDSYDGVKMKFVDDMDIASDGSIWFTDASMKYAKEDLLYDFIEMDPTGRLFRYDPVTQKTTLHMDKLYFANGVALGGNDEFILVNETATARVQRLWLSGPDKGKRDVFYDGLPGGGDNLSFNSKGRFWIAMPSLRLPITENLADKLLFRKLLGGLPIDALIPKRFYSSIVGVGIDGKAVISLQDDSAGDTAYHYITSVNEIDGMLFIGSLAETSIAMLNLSNLK